MRRRLAFALAVAAMLGTSWAVAVEPDVDGSRDLVGVERYPRSWIVAYQRDDDVEPRQFVMSHVDRIRRELRVEDELRVNATVEAVTYAIPEGAPAADVVEHFRSQLGGDVLFRCDGRDCGRSADWANQIFEQAILYGPDRDQHYTALEWRGRLVALYVIERGNQRLYAHLRLLSPRGPVTTELNALLPQRLAEQGWAVIEGVRPAPDGSLDDSARTVLGQLAARLAERATDVGRGEIRVVCHLYGPADTDVLLSASQRCAEAGAAMIGAGANGEGRVQPDIRAFGAGPLLPRSLPPTSRLELVVPGANHAPGH